MLFTIKYSLEELLLLLLLLVMLLLLLLLVYCKLILWGPYPPPEIVQDITFTL